MLHPDVIPLKTRRHLSFDPLIRQIRLRAKQLPDTRDESDCSYSMANAVMSAIAMFSLKDQSDVGSCGGSSRSQASHSARARTDH